MLLLREWETNLWGENSDIQLRSNQRLLNASQTLLPLSLVLNFHHHAPLVIATRTVLLGGLCVPFVPLNKGCSESVRISWNWLRPLGNVACLLLLCLLLHTVDNIKFCFATVLLSPLELTVKILGQVETSDMQMIPITDNLLHWLGLYAWYSSHLDCHIKLVLPWQHK